MKLKQTTFNFVASILLLLVLGMLVFQVNKATKDAQAQVVQNDVQPKIIHQYKTGSGDTAMIHRVWYYPEIQEVFVEYKER